MNKKYLAKIIAVLCSMIMVGSLALIAFGIISWISFWIVAAVCAAIAWYVVPALKKS